ncbi:hypothetical protein KR018_005355 [Drosophila ironensis]|nr:hypothetical protein KR018_005355 [Drosophila ironensis]
MLGLLSFAGLLLLATPIWSGVVLQPQGISYLGSGGLQEEHAVAHTQQNVVRGFDGTVSHYAKSVATPFTQVHKHDTRISNNVYQPAVASYAPPSHLFAQATPEAYHQQPSVFKHPAAQVEGSPVYHQPAHLETPAVYQPQPTYNPSPVVSHQPAVVHYSPAESVSHVSFDGFGTHWGF